MTINSIKQIKKKNIRIFPFQTKDVSFLLYNDLSCGYLLSLLIDKLWFSIFQFNITYIFPFNKFVDKILSELKSFKEEYFIFFLENYFHSSNYAMSFIKIILEKLKKQETKPYIIIHSIKAPKNEIINLINKYDFVLLIITWDIEKFFNDFFYKKIKIEDIWNIIYKDDKWEIKINKQENITENLWEYIIWAYHTKYYSFFPKVKDNIIAIIDDNKDSNDNIYYKWSKYKIIKYFRYSWETEAMLSTWRWCKYNCTYCYRWVKYSIVRQIPLKIIKKDLDYLQKLWYRYIYFYDDCFITTNKDRLCKIVNLLNKYDFTYWISSRYEIFNIKILNEI